MDKRDYCYVLKIKLFYLCGDWDSYIIFSGGWKLWEDSDHVAEQRHRKGCLPGTESVVDKLLSFIAQQASYKVNCSFNLTVGDSDINWESKLMDCIFDIYCFTDGDQYDELLFLKDIYTA